MGRATTKFLAERLGRGEMARLPSLMDEDRFNVQFSEIDMQQIDSFGKVTQRVSELL